MQVGYHLYLIDIACVIGLYATCGQRLLIYPKILPLFLSQILQPSRIHDTPPLVVLLWTDQAGNQTGDQSVYIFINSGNLGVSFVFLENCAIDFSQTLPFSSLHCSLDYKL